LASWGIRLAGRVRAQSALSGVAYTSIGGRKKSPATVREADRARCCRLLRLDPPGCRRVGLRFSHLGSGRKLLKRAGLSPDCGLKLLAATAMVRTLADHTARIATENPAERLTVIEQPVDGGLFFELERSLAGHLAFDVAQRPGCSFFVEGFLLSFADESCSQTLDNVSGALERCF
jgi:hypothetical protein